MSDDNARNGIRGRRPSISPALLTSLRQAYGFTQVLNVRDIGGSSNLNVYFEAEGEPCVARVYRPSVSRQRLMAIQTTREVLLQHGVPCAPARITSVNQKFAYHQDSLMEVESFVPSTAKMDTPERITMAMPWLARIHGVLATLPYDVHGDAPLFSNHIESVDVLPALTRVQDRVRIWSPSREEIEISSMMQDLAERVVIAEGPYLAALKYQRTHGDFWDNNVFFTGNDIVLIADFDYMGRTARTDDLARTLYFALSDFWSESADTDTLIGYARSLVEMYNSAALPPLSTEERRVLPFSIARQPFWWVGNWFVDLDSMEVARNGFHNVSRDLQLAREIMDHAAAWQTALTA